MPVPPIRRPSSPCACAYTLKTYHLPNGDAHAQYVDCVPASLHWLAHSSASLRALRQYDALTPRLRTDLALALLTPRFPIESVIKTSRMLPAEIATGVLYDYVEWLRGDLEILVYTDETSGSDTGQTLTGMTIFGASGVARLAAALSNDRDAGPYVLRRADRWLDKVSPLIHARSDYEVVGQAQAELDSIAKRRLHSAAPVPAKASAPALRGVVVSGTVTKYGDPTKRALKAGKLRPRLYRDNLGWTGRAQMYYSV